MNQQVLGKGAVSALLPFKQRPTSFSDMALIKTRETNSLQLELHFIFTVHSVLVSINKLHVIKNKPKSLTNTDQV
jgi:hypothetical protein